MMGIQKEPYHKTVNNSQNTTMRKAIFIFLTMLSLSCLAQNRLLQNLSYTKIHTEIPYISRIDTLPNNSASFPIECVIGDAFDNYVWEDLALTKQYSRVVNLTEDELWGVCEINRKFAIDKAFVLFSAYFGEIDFVKDILVTITTDGSYIDSIPVGASIMSAYSNIGDFYQPMKWEITSDLRILVYQLKPISTTAIMGDTPVSDTLEAQRIDRIYQLGDDGKFSLIDTKYYKPQMYNKSNFLDRSYDISKGGEQLQ